MALPQDDSPSVVFFHILPILPVVSFAIIIIIPFFVFLVFSINSTLRLLGSSQSFSKSRLRKNPPEWFSSTLLLINNGNNDNNNNNNKISPKWFSSTLLLIRDGQARRKRLIKNCARAFISLSSSVFESSSCCGMFRSLCCLL